MAVVSVKHGRLGTSAFDLLTFLNELFIHSAVTASELTQFCFLEEMNVAEVKVVG